MGEDGGQNVEAYYYGACLTQAVHSIFKALEIEKIPVIRLSVCDLIHRRRRKNLPDPPYGMGRAGTGT